MEMNVGAGYSEPSLWEPRPWGTGGPWSLGENDVVKE